MVDFNTAPNSNRSPGLHFAATLIYERTKEPNIVEVGTAWNPDNAADGWSTLFFAWLTKTYGGNVYSIDIESKHIAASKKITHTYPDCVKYILGDGEAILK